MSDNFQEKVIERLVKVETKQDRMEHDLHSIALSLTELKALANQGRGSLRTFLWMGGLVTGLIGLLGAAAGLFLPTK